jgi:ribonucleoside-diphosphate reductase beta chain
MSNTPMMTAIEAIDWNHPEDETDVELWQRVVQNFWLPEKIALSNDLMTWNTLTDVEKELTKRVFVSLTLLDTMQSNDGMPPMMDDALTAIEKSVLSNFSFMEAVHAKSYSYIFSTLVPTKQEVLDLFRWAKDDPILQRKAQTIMKYYRCAGDTLEDKLKRKVASVMLESFLFYSGFYLPLHFVSKAKLTNTADIIRLIIRDESLHGYYIGYKFQRMLQLADEETADRVKMFAYDLLEELEDVEVQYTQMLYDEVGLTEEVKKFVRYNANKALMNLGLDPLFPATLVDVNPKILAALGGNENHDFFSGGGSTYKVIKVESTQDSDWLDDEFNDLPKVAADSAEGWQF